VIVEVDITIGPEFAEEGRCIGDGVTSAPQYSNTSAVWVRVIVPPVPPVLPPHVPPGAVHDPLPSSYDTTPVTAPFIAEEEFPETTYC
jgi:hypothetical protein